MENSQIVFRQDSHKDISSSTEDGKTITEDLQIAKILDN